MAKLIGVKLQDDQAGQFGRAAKAAGKTVASWLRDLGAAAVAPPVPFPTSGVPFHIPAMPASLVGPAPLSTEIERIASEPYEFPFDPPVPIRRVDATGLSPLECPYCLGVGTNEPSVKDPISCVECGGTGIVREITIVQEMSREEFEAQYPPAEISTNGQKRTAAELSASISGLMVGMGDALKVAKGRTLFNPEHPIPLTGYAARVEARREELKAEGVDLLEQIFPSDTPEEPVRSWAEEFARFRKLGDFGAEAFGEATAHIKKWPKGFKETSEPAQVAWLDETYPLTDTRGKQ